MNVLAHSFIFWIALILALLALYVLPTVRSSTLLPNSSPARCAAIQRPEPGGTGGRNSLPPT